MICSARSNGLYIKLDCQLDVGKVATGFFVLGLGGIETTCKHMS